MVVAVDFQEKARVLWTKAGVGTLIHFHSTTGSVCISVKDFNVQMKVIL